MKYLPPFLTLSVHDSWISGVKFLDIDRDDESYSLLTTSDDAKLKLWSFDTSLKEEYHKLAHINPVSEVNTESGIYSVDAFHHRILTSCKNGEVVLHELVESEIRTVQHYIAHTDVAKHVRWRDPNVFATCGNDKKINVYDIRVATQPNVTSYENAHSLSINTVAWQPGEPFRLISSGFGNVIRFIYARHILTPILKQIR
jgi:WD40 repeat protein